MLAEKKDESIAKGEVFRRGRGLVRIGPFFGVEENLTRQMARLEEGTGSAPVLLPFLFEPDLDLSAYERLSERLEAEL